MNKNKIPNFKGYWITTETPKFAKDDAVYPIDFMTQGNTVVGCL